MAGQYSGAPMACASFPRRASPERSRIGTRSSPYSVIRLDCRCRTLRSSPNKDRIADSIGAFVETHFLTPQNVVERLVGFDFAATASEWLRDQTDSSQTRRCAMRPCCRQPSRQSRTSKSDHVSRAAGRVSAEAVDLVAVVDRLMAVIVELWIWIGPCSTGSTLASRLGVQNATR